MSEFFKDDQSYVIIEYRHLNRKLSVTDSCLPNLKSIMRICPRMCGEEGGGVIPSLCQNIYFT